MIARLKVDSSEYDSKIKRAAQGIQRFVQACHEQGDVIGRVLGDTRKYVESIGNMATVSNTARGKVAELTAAFIDIKSVYNSLSEEERKAPFGTELSKQLDQLKTRINEGKKELEDINRELGDTKSETSSLSGPLEMLAGKFGVNIKQLAGWGAAIVAAKEALNVAKDAFLASEQNLDDWNRAVYSAESTYHAFLTSLNTGDVSGFLSNIDKIVNAANDAYNAIDRLQTTRNIQTPAMQAKMSEVQRMETMLRTGRYIAPIDGRSNAAGIKDGAILTAAQKENIARNLASAMKEIGGMTKTEVQRSTDAINALYNEQALRLQMSNEEFRKGTASVAVFEENLRLAAKYNEFEAQHTRYQLTSTGNGEFENRAYRDNAVNPYEQYKSWSVFKDDGELYQQLLTEIRARTSAESQYYGQMGRAYRGINRAEGYSPYSSGGAGGNEQKITLSGIPGLIEMPTATMENVRAVNALLDKLAQFQTAKANATNVDEFFAAQIGEQKTQRAIDRQSIAMDVTIDPLSISQLQADMKTKIEEMTDSLPPVEIKATGVNAATKDAEQMALAWSTAGSVINSVAGALNNIESPAAKIASIVAEAIANIALGYASAIGKEGKKSKDIWAFIAAAAAGIVEMGVAISQVHGATGYAEGGVIKGTTYSGDLIPANGGTIGLNAGELILNKAQQNNLVNDMKERAKLEVVGEVQGEKIVLVANRYLRRSGQGEIVTW